MSQTISVKCCPKNIWIHHASQAAKICSNYYLSFKWIDHFESHKTTCFVLDSGMDEQCVPSAFVCLSPALSNNETEAMITHSTPFYSGKQYSIIGASHLLLSPACDEIIAEDPNVDSSSPEKTFIQRLAFIKTPPKKTENFRNVMGKYNRVLDEVLA